MNKKKLTVSRITGTYYKSNFINMFLSVAFLILSVISTESHAVNDQFSKAESKIDIHGATAQEFPHDSHKKITAVIGTKSQTRISFGSYSIKEVVGDSNKYKMIHDSQGMSIFILPKVKAGEKIDITIISSGGKVQDLSLVVKDTEGSVISIGGSKNKANSSVSDVMLEAKEMLKAMVRNKKGKYDVTSFTVLSNTKNCKNCRKNKMADKSYSATLVDLRKNNYELSAFSDLEIREIELYNYKLIGLKGLVLEIKNYTSAPIVVTEEDLSKLFKNTLLTSMKYKVIPAKSSVNCYVVLRDIEQKL